MKKYLIMAVVGITLFSLLLTSCIELKVGYVGTNIGNEISGTYRYFTGTQNKIIDAEAGQIIEINYTSEVKKGELSLKVLDSSQKTIAELEGNSTGTREIQVDQDGKYTLVIKGAGTEGNFKVDWEVK